MSNKNYNDFCLYCTGDARKDIHECDDTNCPFYPFRFGGLESNVEADICSKLLQDKEHIKNETNADAH